MLSTINQSQWVKNQKFGAANSEMDNLRNLARAQGDQDELSALHMSQQLPRGINNLMMSTFQANSTQVLPVSKELLNKNSMTLDDGLS